jgi:hypothetical protein
MRATSWPAENIYFSEDVCLWIQSVCVLFCIILIIYVRLLLYLLPHLCNVYHYILETNLLSRENSYSCSVITVCATSNVISLVKYVSSFHISTSRRLCAVPNMAVCCSFLVSWFPDILLRYFTCDNRFVPHNNGTVGFYDPFRCVFTVPVRLPVITYIYFPPGGRNQPPSCPLVYSDGASVVNPATVCCFVIVPYSNLCIYSSMVDSFRFSVDNQYEALLSNSQFLPLPLSYITKLH